MDSRIGQVVRNGQDVFYAFPNGYSAPAIEGSLSDVEVALGLRIAPSVKVDSPIPSKLKTYSVNVYKRFPAWDEVGGFDYTVEAISKSDAVQKAREYVRQNCLYSGADGQVYYKATQIFVATA